MISWIKLYVQRLGRDDVPGLSAELAYRFLFAIFPFAIFLAALTGFVAAAFGMANPTSTIMDAIGGNLPQNLAGPIRDQLDAVLTKARPDLLSFGVVFALYAAAGGTNALFKAMNRAYELPESRPFLFRFALAVVLTVLAGAGIVGSFVIIVGTSLVTNDLAQRAGVAGTLWDAVALIRWPIVLGVLAFAAAVLFRYGANVRPPWRWALLGGLVFGIGWLVATFGFALYVSRFSHYDSTYGALGGVIVLMLWFYLTALVLVGSAEVVALLVRAREPELLERRRGEVDVERGVREVANRARNAVPPAAPAAPASPVAIKPREDASASGGEAEDADEDRTAAGSAG